MHIMNPAYHSEYIFELYNMHLFTGKSGDWIGVCVPNIKTRIYLWETKVRKLINRQEFLMLKFFQSKAVTLKINK